MVKLKTQRWSRQAKNPDWNHLAPLWPEDESGYPLSLPSYIRNRPSYISLGKIPCSPCSSLFLGPTYVILRSIWGSNPVCSICIWYVYWWLNGILVLVKALSSEKWYCCSANRMWWSYQWFTMSPLKQMVLWSLEPFSGWVLKSFVLHNFLRGWDSLVFAPDPHLPSDSWFWSWLQCPPCVSGVKRNPPCLGKAWTMLTLKEGRMDDFVQSLVLSFKERCLSNNPVISCIYHVFTTAQQVLGWQLHRWVQSHTQHREWGSPLWPLGFWNVTPALWAFFSSSEKCCVSWWISWATVGHPRTKHGIDLSGTWLCRKGCWAPSCVAVLPPRWRNSPHQPSWTSGTLGLQFFYLQMTSGIPSNWSCYLSFMCPE